MKGLVGWLSGKGAYYNSWSTWVLILEPTRRSETQQMLQSCHLTSAHTLWYPFPHPH